MKKLLWLLLCLLPVLSYADGKISNVTFAQQRDVIHINYFLRAKKLHAVQVIMSVDGVSRRLKSVTGDVGLVRGWGSKLIVLDVAKEFNGAPISGEVSFTVQGEDEEYDTSFGFQYVISGAAPLGLGYALYSKWGGYVRAKVSWTALGFVSDSGSSSFIFKKKAYYRQAYTAGVIRRLNEKILVYGGLGYGVYTMVNKGKDGPESYASTKYHWDKPKQKGLELECGVMFDFNGFSLSAGYGSIAGVKMPFLPNLCFSIGYVPAI